MDEPRLKSGLFGYSRKSVQASMNERDLRMVQSAQELREAESRAAETASELEAVRRDATGQKERADRAEASISRLRTELDEMRTGRIEADRRIGQLETSILALTAERDEAAERARLIEGEASPTSIGALKEVLDATRAAVAEILEDGRRRAEEELRESERERDALRGEIEQLAAWRDKVMPLADEVRRSIDEARTHTTSLSGHLSVLAQTPPPLTLAGRPTRLEESDDLIRLEGSAQEAPREEPATPWKQSSAT